MTTADLQTTTSHLEQTFREWVRKGMREPAPSFEALRDVSDYLPADVIEMLVTERGLTSFWNYGQAVRQLSGGSSDADLERREVPGDLV
jgi:translation initiation factor 2B subunit (eIF-2B alpha/beta/delta family)